MCWGICPRVSGGQTEEGSPSWGPQSLACQAPSGAQVSLCDQSLKLFVMWDSPISQSVIRAGPQVVGDQGELPHVQQHWSHTQVEICYGLVGAHLRLNIVFECDVHTQTLKHAERRCIFCTFMYVHLSTLICVFLVCTSTHKHVWEKRCTYTVYIFFFPQTQTSFFLTLQSKPKSACLEGLFKHASWKIYGRLELNCPGLLLEKDRWGLSRDMFYQFGCVSFRCMFKYWRNTACVLLWFHIWFRGVCLWQTVRWTLPL